MRYFYNLIGSRTVASNNKTKLLFENNQVKKSVNRRQFSIGHKLHGHIIILVLEKIHDTEYNLCVKRIKVQVCEALKWECCYLK